MGVIWLGIVSGSSIVVTAGLTGATASKLIGFAAFTGISSSLHFVDALNPVKQAIDFKVLSSSVLDGVDAEVKHINRYIERLDIVLSKI